MKTKQLVMMLGILVALTVTSCGFVPPSVRPAEMSQEEYASSGARAGAEVVEINLNQATNVDRYRYTGAYRPKEEVLLNVDGKAIVVGEYIDHKWIMNAVSDTHPTVVKKLVDVNKCFTDLRIVHWGVAGDYQVDTYSFCTTTDPIRQSQRDRFGRIYYGNVVTLLPGTDQAPLDRFNPVINVYPNNAVRQFLYGIGIGKPGPPGSGR